MCHTDVVTSSIGSLKHLGRKSPFDLHKDPTPTIMKSSSVITMANFGDLPNDVILMISLLQPEDAENYTLATHWVCIWASHRFLPKYRALIQQHRHFGNSGDTSALEDRSLGVVARMLKAILADLFMARFIREIDIHALRESWRSTGIHETRTIKTISTYSATLPKIASSSGFPGIIRLTRKSCPI